MAKCGVALRVLILQMFVASGQSQGETLCDGYLTSRTCSENVSCGQSSIYSGTQASSEDGRMGTSADCQAAIDGNNTTHWASVNGSGSPNCFSTAFQRHPYWWVDLGRTVNIHNITMYIEYHGRLDNAIVNLDGQLIFNFTPPSNRQNPYYITSPLPRAGRNISVQYLPRSTNNAIVVLCEVEVWGCPLNRYGGPRCERDCSANCNGNGGETTCDSISANCTNGCKTGWWGGTCDQSCSTKCSPGRCDRNSGCLQCDGKFAAPLCTVCQSGWWGSQCDQVCPHKCSPGQCGMDRGCTQCINHYAAPNCADCQAGWWGSDCDQACPAQCSTPGRCDRNGCAQCNNHYAAPFCADCRSGWWGNQCDRECPQRCSSTGCDRTSGCTQCDNHFVSPNCTDCQPKWWGADCNQQCHSTRCSDCDRHTGCLQCTGHFAAPSCTVCSGGFYKTGSSQNESCTECGAGCRDRTCSDGTGHCQCVPGYKPTTCQQACDVGRYGQDCEEGCSNGCNGTCNTTNGACTCLTGWTGDTCQECTMGLWGASNCSLNCGAHCAGSGTCHIEDGICTQGCKDGWNGPECTQEQAATGSSDVAGVAGGIVGAIIVVAIVVVVVIMVFRRRRQSKGRDALRGMSDASSRAPHMPPFTQPEAAEASSSKHHKPTVSVTPVKRNAAVTDELNAVPLYGNVSQDFSTGEPDRRNASPPALAPKPRATRGAGNVYENLTLASPQIQLSAESEAHTSHNRAGFERAEKSVGDADDLSEVLTEEKDDVYNTEDLYAVYKSTRPQLDALQQYLIDALASGELSGQFNKFAKGMKLPHNDGMTDENVRKNRFKAMCAYDFNRVHLHRPKGDPESDYINASYIKGCRGDKQYIATQGPRDYCVPDLWWMVWQEKVTQMVMLTNIQEDGKDKCEEYWPASGKTQTYGRVTVRALEVQDRSDYVIRPFLLKAKGTSAQRQVIQYHYNTWPDHGVPQAAALVDFWRYVKARGDPTVPLLVHCSAGVGRTGTFIAQDIASEREALGREVNVKDIVTELREQRCIMVQSEAQYKFLHEVVLEAHTSRGTRIRVDKFEETFPDTITVDNPNQRIDEELKMLQEMGKHAPKPKHTMAEMEENRNKNRNQDALPDDKHLAYLTVHVRGRNQYINAVYMSSFLHRRGLLLTQLPIPNNTLVDFWRMVDGCDVKTVVSLGSEDEHNTVKAFCQYWPLTVGEVLDSGHYSITLTSCNKMNSHLIYCGLTVINKTDNMERQVQLYHYKAWAGEVPDETASLLQLVDTIKARAEDDVTSPVVIQCIDGAARSGLFCAVYDIINRVTYDDEIDVYLTARHVQTVRPQAVATEKQYRFLYQVAQEYIRHLNVYQNAGVA